MRALVVSLALAACGAHSSKPLDAWTTAVQASSPLVGKTYDARTRAFVDFDRAEDVAIRAPFVLLGEKHDNPDHHRLQARVLGAMVAAGRRPALVFEMIDLDLQPAVDAYLATGRATVDGLRAVLEWDKRGWPAWALYRPIFEVAVAAHLKIVAAGLPHDVIHRLVHEGVPALPPEIGAHVRLAPLAPALQASLDAEIQASHCGFLPDAMIAPMSLAQRVKDALMADLMLQNAAGGVVLVAGNGHVRIDWGVPFDLARPGAVAISFVEVNGSTAPATYEADEPATFLVFTPRVDDADPCAQFKR